MTCSTSRQSDKEECSRGRRSPRLIGSFSATRYSIPGQVYDRVASSSLSDADVSPLPSLRVTVNPPELRNQCVRLALYTVAESYVRNIVLAREQPYGDVQSGRVTGENYDDHDDDRDDSSGALREEDFLLPAWPKKNLEKINGSCFGEALAEGAYHRVVDNDNADAKTSLAILPLKAWAYGSYPAVGLSLLIRRVLVQTACAVAVGVRKHINDRRRGAYYGVKDRATQSNKNSTEQEQEQQQQQQRLRVQGSHAFVIIGFDLDDSVPGGGIFVFMDNSGTGWGHAGYGICSFEFVDTSVDDIAQAVVPARLINASAAARSAKSNNQYLSSGNDEYGGPSISRPSSSSVSGERKNFPVYQQLGDDDKYHVKCCGCDLCQNATIPACTCFACSSTATTTTNTTTTTPNATTTTSATSTANN